MEVRCAPLVVNLPPIVKDVSQGTPRDINENKYLCSSVLPPECMILYDTATIFDWKKMDSAYEQGVMDASLADLIRYNIRTPGCTLYQTLKKKSYLRITIGDHARQSPGIPYVLEIWPPGSQSPVHNHGSTFAIVKVLYGTIENRTFNKMPSTASSQPEALLKFDAHEGQVMWMSPDWYQTHQLCNTSIDFCATLNCYRYGEEDPVQWNQFDYVNAATGHTENFLPNTDFNYAKMWMTVLKEFYNSETIRLMKEQIENLMLENDFLRMEVTTLRKESCLQQRRLEDAEIGRRAAEARCSEAEGQVAGLTNVLRNHLNSQQLDNAEALISNLSRGGTSNTDMDTSQEDYEEMLLVTSTGAAAEHVGNCMGVFLLAGEHNNRPYYRLKHTLKTQGARFLYSHENGTWYVSGILGKAG